MKNQETHNDDHKNSHHDHHHHDHTNCTHDHHHDHEKCEHDSHDDFKEYQRHQFTEDELAQFRKENFSKLFSLSQEQIAENNFGKAVILLEIALENKNEDSNEMNAAKHQLSLCYGILGEYVNSLVYWDDVLKYLSENVDQVDLIDGYYNASLCFMLGNQLEKFYDLAIQGLTLSKEFLNDEYTAAFQIEIGKYFFEKNDIEKSLEYYTNAHEIFIKQNNFIGIVNVHLFTGFIYNAINDIQKAKHHLEKCIEIAKEHEIVAEVETQIEEAQLALSKINQNNLKSKLLDFS